MNRYAIYQPYEQRHDHARSEGPMWAYATPPTKQELAILVKAAKQRHENPQPGGGIDYSSTLTVKKEKAIKIGSLPVVYFRKTIDTIDLADEDLTVAD